MIEDALIEQAKAFRILAEQLEKQRDEATTKLAAQSADAARLREALKATGNYVADSEDSPRHVLFANGRTVHISKDHTFLIIGWQDE
jgi:hypothetical protein